jgi:hypothetical protein
MFEFGKLKVVFEDIIKSIQDGSISSLIIILILTLIALFFPEKGVFFKYLPTKVSLRSYSIIFDSVITFLVLLLFAIGLNLVLALFLLLIITLSLLIAFIIARPGFSSFTKKSTLY